MDPNPLTPPPADSRVLALIEEAFVAQCGHPLGGLTDDLAELVSFVNPTASGASFRNRIAELPPVFADRVLQVESVVSPWVVVLPDGEAVVTPEGRSALETGGTGVWPPNVLALLAGVYRDLAVGKLSAIADLLSGRGPLATPAAPAAVLLLLLNRSTDDARALPGTDANEHVDEAISEIVHSAALAVNPDAKLSTKELSFRKGYGLSEATRRLGPKNLATGARVYVRPGREERALGFVVAELARRRMTSTEVGELFDRTLAAYRTHRPTLASEGCAFERSGDSERLRKSLVACVGVHGG
jgi:hypothetical protein